jgi:hypothetical protein
MRRPRGGRGHEEVYAVLRGRATFTLDGVELDAPAGTFVRVAPEVRRRAVASERARAIVDELKAEQPGSPGVPIAEALLAIGTGDRDAAAQRLEGLLAERPELRAPLEKDPDLGSLLR